MSAKENKNRYWHAKFDTGEEIIADYVADEDSLDVWYLSGPDADWQSAIMVTNYKSAVQNLNVVRTWAPHFEGFTNDIVITYHPVRDDLTVQMWLRSKGTSGVVKAEDKSIYAQDEPTEETK